MKGPFDLNKKSNFLNIFPYFLAWIWSWSFMFLLMETSQGKTVCNLLLKEKTRIDNSYQLCMMKVLLITVAFEDGVKCVYWSFVGLCSTLWKSNIHGNPQWERERLNSLFCDLMCQVLVWFFFNLTLAEPSFRFATWKGVGWRSHPWWSLKI